MASFAYHQMKAIMSNSLHDSSFSHSKRHLNWGGKEEAQKPQPEPKIQEKSQSKRYFNWSKKNNQEEGEETLPSSNNSSLSTAPESNKICRKRTSSGGFRLRSVFTMSRNRSNELGHRVIGTLFGFRRGHVHLAFQENPKSPPAFLVELASSTSGLVREMASGLVRIALETEKKNEKKSEKLLDEQIWRTYFNGRKCGFAGRRECGAFEWKLLQAVSPVSMGAGVLPSTGNENKDELMFMRAKFERVVGSRDSEAFYMMNPDRNGGPELSIYLLRV